MVQNYRSFSQAPCVSMSVAGMRYVDRTPGTHKTPLFLSPLGVTPFGTFASSVPPQLLMSLLSGSPANVALAAPGTWQ